MGRTEFSLVFALRPTIEAVQAYDQDLVEERAPNGFTELADVITRQELDAIAAEYKRIAGFDIERLNRRGRRDPALNLLRKVAD